MKRRLLVVMVFGVMVAATALMFAATASAAQVTKIMYAQENSDVYSYTNQSHRRGLRHPERIDRLDRHQNRRRYHIPRWAGRRRHLLGPADRFPPDPYADLILNGVESVMTLDDGTNPEAGSYELPGGWTAYIAVLPFVGDNNYTIDVKFNGTEVPGFPKTGQAYASAGEVYVPSDGDWISCAQLWPGSDSLYYACWCDQVYEDVAPAGKSDVLSSPDGEKGSYYPSQIPQRTTIGSAGQAHSSKWYVVAPQIWPGAAVVGGQNVIVNGTPQPGTVSWTTAPLWYTYSYPDASQTAQKMGYFFTTTSTSSASKRNYSGSTSTNAGISFKFYGNTLDWYYTATPLGCKANVTIDGVAPTGSQGPAVVDQSAAAYVYYPAAVAHYVGLGAGYHTIVCTNSGTRGSNHVASPASKFFTSDAFYAADGPSGSPVMHENNYDGSTAYQFSTVTPPGNPNPAPHGGTYSGSTSTNDAVACYFSGTAIDFYYATTPLGCRANVLIDGQPPTALQGPAQIDESSLDGGYHYLVKASYTGLGSDATHIILIYNTGQRGAYHVASPASKFFTVDAFNYTPTSGPTVWVDDK